MQFPENSKAAAKMVKKAAKNSDQALSSYCIAKGVHPSVVYNWQERNGGYDRPTLEKLLAPL